MFRLENISRFSIFSCIFTALLINSVTCPVRGQVTVTVDATQVRKIGGVSDLERSRFFNYHGTLVPPSSTNLGNLQNQLISPDFFHATAGRTSTEFDQFITNGLSEDPNNASFIDMGELVGELQGNYRNFVVSGTRWRPMRDIPEPFIVNSGRSASFWPAFFRTDPNSGITSNFYPYVLAYADFLITYLDEVVYGPNSYLPIDSDRMWIELLNEPELHLSSNFTTQDLIDYHRIVADMVKAVHPEAKIVGPSLAITSFQANNYERWNNTLKPFIEGAGASMDALSYHPYERYRGFANGTFAQDIMESPGRVQATIDLIENHNINFHGDLIPLSITEYGSWQLWDTETNGEPNIGNYSIDAQQWDLCRNIKEKMFVFLDQPNIILNAVPFVSPRDFRPDIPTNLNADNVMFQQDASGIWEETIIGNFFRLLSKIDGQYVTNSCSNPNIQVQSFRDGDQLYVMLNNLSSSVEIVQLELETGSADVGNAIVDRVYRSIGGVNTFVDNQSIAGALDAIILSSEECAVITLTLTTNEEFVSERSESTHYGESTVVPIDLAGASGNISVNLDPTDAVDAKVRVSFSRPGFAAGESFFVVVNNNFNFMVDVGELELDDGDDQAYTRELDIPAAILANGENQFNFQFGGNGGHVASVAVVVGRETSNGAVTINPSEINAVNGFIASGDVNGLQNSDDRDLVLRVGKAGSIPAIRLLVDANATELSPASFILTLESRANTPNIAQNLQMFNWNTGEFESVDSRAISLQDSAVDIELSVNVANYINQKTGEIQARIDLMPTGPVWLSPWSVSLDQMIWTSGN